jgi:hypothetical protein
MRKMESRRKNSPNEGSKAEEHMTARTHGWDADHEHDFTKR